MGNLLGVISIDGAPASDLDEPVQVKAFLEASSELNIPGFPTTEAFRQVAIDQFHQSIACFPKHLSENYLETSRCERSTVLQLETPELLFLQCDNFNPWSASWRCIKYWDKRKQIFGERAYLPMLQSSTKGALSEIDIEILKTGVVSIGGFERSGTGRGQVICVDLDLLRSFQVIDGVAPTRSIFYLLTICMENVETFEGEVTFVLFIDGDVGQYASELKAWQVMIMQSFPMNKADVHIVPCDKTVQVQASEYKHRDGLKIDMHIHGNDSQEQPSSSLRELGLPTNLIPRRIGGGGLVERAQLWHEERSRIEFEKCGSMYVPNASLSSMASDSTGLTRQHEALSSDDTGTRQEITSSNMRTSQAQESSPKKRKAHRSEIPHDADDRERQELIRKRNAAYSKRKYHRKKIEIEVLKKQTTDMQQQNEKLRNEGKMLEELLRSAQTTIALSGARNCRDSGAGVVHSIPEAKLSPLESFISNHRDFDSLSLPLSNLGLIQQLVGLPANANASEGWSRHSEAPGPGPMFQTRSQAIPNTIYTHANGNNNGSPPTVSDPQLSMLNQAPLLSALMSVAAAPSAANYAQATTAPGTQMYSDLLNGRAPVTSHVNGLKHVSAPVSHAPVALQFQSQPSQGQVEHFLPSMHGGMQQPDPIAQLLEQLLRARQTGQG